MMITKFTPAFAELSPVLRNRFIEAFQDVNTMVETARTAINENWETLDGHLDVSSVGRINNAGKRADDVAMTMMRTV